MSTNVLKKFGEMNLILDSNRVKELLHLISTSNCWSPVLYIRGFDQSGGGNQVIT